jgi:hypothetical protein
MKARKLHWGRGYNYVWIMTFGARLERQREEGKYYIDGSILENFSHRLPELTLKKLGEKMNVRYFQDTYGRRVLYALFQRATGECYTRT